MTTPLPAFDSPGKYWAASPRSKRRATSPVRSTADPTTARPARAGPTPPKPARAKSTSTNKAAPPVKQRHTWLTTKFGAALAKGLLISIFFALLAHVEIGVVAVRPEVHKIVDHPFQWMQPVNTWLRELDRASQQAGGFGSRLVSALLLIDSFVLFGVAAFVVFALLSTADLICPLACLLEHSLRAVCMLLVELPVPQHNGTKSLIWRYPGFPSHGETNTRCDIRTATPTASPARAITRLSHAQTKFASRIASPPPEPHTSSTTPRAHGTGANDFFFSGHVALPVVCALELWRLGYHRAAVLCHAGNLLQAVFMVTFQARYALFHTPPSPPPVHVSSALRPIPHTAQPTTAHPISVLP